MSYSKIWVHAVWSTKNREPLMKGAIKETMCNHIMYNAKTKGIYIDRINGYTEHLHALMLLKNDLSISKQMQLLKGESSLWANKEGILGSRFEWADKYFAASVSEDKLDKVRAYISFQKEHHRKQTFSEEYNFFMRSLGFSEDDG